MNGSGGIGLTDELLLSQVVTPVVLGLFANDEWDGIAIVDGDDSNDGEDDSNEGDGDSSRTVRVIVCSETVEVALDHPGSTETLHEFQLRLIAELKEFIAGSEFGRHRGPQWRADDDNEGRARPVITRMTRPDFAGPSDCTLRRLRIGTSSLRLGGHRCRSAPRGTDRG